MRAALFLFAANCISIGSAAAQRIDCPSPPTQASKDSKAAVEVAVGKLGPLKATELKTEVQRTTVDLLGKLPQPDRVYLEQMMFSAYCSSLNADVATTPAQKSAALRSYAAEVRGVTQQPHRSDGSIQNNEARPPIKPPSKTSPQQPAIAPTTPPSDRAEPARAATKNVATVNCYVTVANLCRFRDSSGKSLTTLDRNSGKPLAAVPSNQIWDSASYTSSKDIFVVRKKNLAAIYRASLDKVIFDYKYDDIELELVPGKGHEYGTDRLEAYYIKVTQNGKRGIVDSSGASLIPIAYDQVLSSWRDPKRFFRVIENKKWGVLDESGAVILPPIYEDVNPYYDSRIGFTAVVVRNGATLQVDDKGKEVLAR